MIRFNQRLLPLLILGACAFLTSALAQTGTGTIQGAVMDPTGAVIAGSEVTLTHTATGRTFAARTNEAGLYLFPSAAIGGYEISVASSGMKVWKGKFVLQVGQTAVVDVTLTVGDAATQITVAGDVTPLLTLTSPTLSNVLERTRIEQLPLNGRFVQNLAMVTVPGMEGSGNTPRVYGLARGAVQFVQDGAVLGNRDQDVGASTRPPGIDTVQEFRVETNNSSAKFSRPASVIISTKSGTNALHGSFFETLRNNGIGLARARQDTYLKPPQLNRNEFGASLGGPVYVPKLYNGKNRTFFFFGYEAFRQVSGSTVATTLPTMAMRRGDFSGLVDGTGRLNVLYDPWTTTSGNWQRTPYPGNQIPAARQSPMSKYLFGVTPEPTLPGVNPLISNNYFAPGGSRRLEHTETVRIDHRLSSRDQVFARYSFGKQWQRSLNRATNPPTSAGETGYMFFVVPDHSGTFTWTRSISPTLFSETIFSVAREDWTINATGAEPSTLLEKLGVPLPAPRPLAGQQQRNIGFGDPGTFFYWSQEGRRNITQTLTVDQNITKIHGRHSLQFGGRFRRGTVDVEPDAPVVMAYYHSLGTSLYDPQSGSTYGAVPYTGHNLANFYLGIARSYAAPMNRPPYYMAQNEYQLYFQDDIKIGQRLTINAGMRYENYPPMKEKDNLLSGFDPATKSVLIGRPLEELYKLNAVSRETIADYQGVGVKFATPREAGLPDGLLKGDPRAFGPRAGFAYRVGSGRRNTVVRGGYALFRHYSYTRAFTWFMRTTPPLGYQRSLDLNNAAQSPDGLPNYLLRSAPPVIAGVNSRTALDATAARTIAPGSFSTIFFAPEQPAAKAHQWNLTLEREVLHNTVVRLGYVGTHGSNLDQYTNLNDAPNNYIWFSTTGQPLPTGRLASVATRPFDQTVYGSINRFGKTGWSNASSFRAELERRYSRGVGFQLFYVMTNAFIVGGEAENGPNLLAASQYMPGAVPKDDHERNRFVNYRRDTNIAKHRVRWNWIVDLPFGTGQPVGRSAGRFLNRVIGGWQLAGFGNLQSRWWELPTSNWGRLSDVEIYGKQYPIEDCRSGTCIRGYLYYNGYIPANRINSVDRNGKPNGVMGVPSNYKPSSIPVFPTPADGGSASDPNYAYYESNTVWVKMQNGTLQRTAIDTNLHPWRNQYLLGPMIWSVDASLFKRIPITERVAFRFNADFFNVLNMPGTTMPGSLNGIISLNTSAQAARVLQLTARLTW